MAEGPVRVLEVGCGTGALTAHLIASAPAGSSLVVTDLVPALLDLAREVVAAEAPARAEHGVTVEVALADACNLSGYPEGTFNIVIGHMVFGQLSAEAWGTALREACRVLQPGGSLVFDVWDGGSDRTGLDAPNAEHRAMWRAIGDKYWPADTPCPLDAPFAHDEGSVRRALADAGFAEVEIFPACLSLRAPSAAAAAQGLVRGTPLCQVLQGMGHSPGDAAAWLMQYIGAAFGREPEIPVISLQVQATKAPLTS